MREHKNKVTNLRAKIQRNETWVNAPPITGPVTKPGKYSHNMSLSCQDRSSPSIVLKRIIRAIYPLRSPHRQLGGGCKYNCMYVLLLFSCLIALSIASTHTHAHLLYQLSAPARRCLLRSTLICHTILTLVFCFFYGFALC